jgi:hypothetical protein
MRARAAHAYRRDSGVTHVSSARNMYRLSEGFAGGPTSLAINDIQNAKRFSTS